MSGPTFATDLYENGGIEKRNIDIEHQRRKSWKKSSVDELTNQET